MISKVQTSLAAGLFAGCLAAAASARADIAPIWRQDNLDAWCTVPFDALHRGPEARAQMLENLGFEHFAYDWRAKDVPTFDAELDALKRHGIDLLAWWYPFNADDPEAKATLDIFRRHGVHPQLWVMQAPTSRRASQETQADQPATPAQQAERVRREADRIRALVALAAPYGCPVELYNHNGWFGREDNELAIIDRLQSIGMTGVGMVYNFSHARDALHDDSKDFPALWARIKDHVVAVNVTGIDPQGREVYPGQGDGEKDMMEVIQRSGWTGPVGVVAEMGGDAAITLRKNLEGLKQVAAQLK